MGDGGDAYRERPGCLTRLLGLAVFLCLAALGVGLWFVAQAQDLSDLDGTGAGAAGEARNLREVLARSLSGGHEVTLSEAEINRYLAATLKAEQGGLLAKEVDLEEVAVRLEDGRAEIILVRSLRGRPWTVSMFLRIEQVENPDGSIETRILRNGGQFHESVPNPPVGGRFGRLEVPEGFLHLVLPSFTKLAKVYRSGGAGEPLEIDLIEEMSRIRIEDGKLVLSPFPSVGMGVPGS